VKRIILPFLIVAVAASASRAAAADLCSKAALSSPSWDARNLEVSVRVTPAIPIKGQGAVWTLVDGETGKVVSAAVQYEERPGADPQKMSNRVNLIVTAPLEQHGYTITVTNLKFEGCAGTTKPVFASFAAGKSVGKRPTFDLNASEDRDSSDIYLSGALTGGTGAKPAYIADLKAQYKRYLDHAGRVGLRPQLDFVASTNPSNNSNYFTWGIGVPLAVGPRATLSPQFVLESDPGHHYINWLVPVTADLTPKSMSYVHLVEAYAQPMAGIEVGGNLHNSTSASSNQSVVRPLVGVRCYLNVWQGTDKKFYVSVVAVDRWPLTAEPRFSSTSSGLVFLDMSKAARPYGKATLGLDVTKLLGFSLKYEYGDLPPVYTRVKNKVSITVVFKGKL
jgi:hypothetical protein